MLGERRAVEKAVHEGKDGAIRACIVNRAAHYKAVCLFKFRSSLIYQIVVENTFPQLAALAARNTSPDALAADMDQLRFDP